MMEMKNGKMWRKRLCRVSPTAFEAKKSKVSMHGKTGVKVNRRKHKFATQMIRNDTWQFEDSQKGNRLLCFGGLLPCVHGVDPLELIQIVRQIQRNTAEANNMMKCWKAKQKQKPFGKCIIEK